MPVLPSEVPTGKVVAQYYFVSEDMVDADTDPSLDVVSGDVIFTCSAKRLRMPTKPATLIPLDFRAKFNSSGQLVSANDPSVGIELPATDSLLFNPTAFTWTVTFNLWKTSNKYTIPVEPFSIQVPEGQTVDLTTLTPVDTSPGVITIQGPPGPVTSMNDADVAALIEDTAPSAAREALDATFGPLFGTGTEYSDDFSQHPDGPLAKALTGQAYSQHFIAPEAEVKVTDGYATYDNTADLGGYASVLLDSDVVWFGGTFKFTSYSTGGGMAVFAAAEEDIEATITAGQGIPRLAAHLIITPENISMDVCLTKGGTVTGVFNKVFSTPLLADDDTEYSAWVALDKKRGIAYVIDPNGDVHVMSHVGFKIPARWHFFEPFRSAGAAGKTLAKFRTVQADSRSQSRLSTLAGVHRGQAALKAAKAAENLDALGAGDHHTMTLTTTPTEVTGTTVTFTVPPSGNVLVALEGLLNVTAAGPVHFGIMNGGGALVSVRTVATETNHSGRASVRLPYATGATPGTEHTIKMCAYRGTSAAAQLVMGNFGAAGSEVYSAASLTVATL